MHRLQMSVYEIFGVIWRAHLDGGVDNGFSKLNLTLRSRK